MILCFHLLWVCVFRYQRQQPYKQILSSNRARKQRARIRDSQKGLKQQRLRSRHHQKVHRKTKNKPKPKSARQSTENETQQRAIVLLPFTKAYKPYKTISSFLLKPTDKIPFENQGVYSITCDDCKAQYIFVRVHTTSEAIEIETIGNLNNIFDSLNMSTVPLTTCPYKHEVMIMPHKVFNNIQKTYV